MTRERLERAFYQFFCETRLFAGKEFLHKSRVPLEEADLRDKDENQIEMFDEECEGMCGV